MPKKKSKRGHEVSKGLKSIRTARRVIRRAGMKIKRWQRYQEEIKADKRKGKASRWDTSGLVKHIQYMKTIAARKPKRAA